MPEPDVEAEYPPLIVVADGDVMQLRALMRAGDEVLAPVLGELDRLAQQPGGPGDQHLLGPRVHDLDPEAAADIGCDDVHLAEVQPELGRDGGPNARRRLRRGPQAQPGRLVVPVRQDAATFQRGGCRSLDLQLKLEYVRRGGDRRCCVATLLDRIGRQIAGDVIVHQIPAGARCLDAHDGGQRVVADVDQVGRVLGRVPVGRDHHHDRLADVVHLAASQRVRRAAVGERGMGDQQRERLGQPAG